MRNWLKKLFYRWPKPHGPGNYDYGKAPSDDVDCSHSSLSADMNDPK